MEELVHQGSKGEGQKNRMCKFPEARNITGLHALCYEFGSRLTERLRVLRWVWGNL